MKKLLYLPVIGFLLSCGNDTVKTETTPASPAVENVEGNIPDSTNSVNLNGTLPVDSSHLRDSTNR
ncbi:MAG TPA: hypothetical protein VER36_09780 [Flavisolibacter sp.]|nr:hypothetical protein [Flavisolibacter sp.]